MDADYACGYPPRQVAVPTAATIAEYPRKRDALGMATPPTPQPRTRFVDLYKRLGFTQLSLEERTGVSQSAISRYAKGRDIDPTHAAALAIALETSTAYLNGETDDPSPKASDPALPEHETLESALLRALDKRRHTLADTRAVEDALSSAVGLAKAVGDLDSLAAAWLDAAAALRLARLPITPTTLLMRVTEALVSRSVDLNGDGDRQLRDLGGSPPTKPVKIPV